MHLLVVDDEPRLLSLLERGLRTQGFDVQAAAERRRGAVAGPRRSARAGGARRDDAGRGWVRAARGVAGRGARRAGDHAHRPVGRRGPDPRAGAGGGRLRCQALLVPRADRSHPRPDPPQVRAAGGASAALAAPAWTSTSGSSSHRWACSRCPSREFTLLAHLMRNAGQVLTRSQLAEGAWDALTTCGPTWSTCTSPRCARSSAPGAIETVRGVGYRMLG